MPKAKKQKNGKWRCQLYLDGHNYSFTASTRADAEYLAMEHKRIHGNSAVPALTLSEAIDRYIQNKSNILSPATIRGYGIAKKIPSQIFSIPRFANYRPASCRFG